MNAPDLTRFTRVRLLLIDVMVELDDQGVTPRLAALIRNALMVIDPPGGTPLHLVKGDTE